MFVASLRETDFHRPLIRPTGPSVRGETVEGLIERLARLMRADCVLALESGGDLHSLVGAVGDDGDIDRLVDNRAKLAALLADAEADCGDTHNVRVFRCTLDDGSALAIRVLVEGSPDLLIVAWRAAGRDGFNLNEERAARRMSDWIGDYARLWLQLRANRRSSDGLRAALDLIGTAVFVIDGRDAEPSANRAGRALLAAGDGLRLVDGRLTAASLDDAARLQSAIIHARGGDHETGAGSQQAPVLSIRRRQRRPLSVAVMRATARSGLGEGSVVVHAVDPESDIEQPIAPTCAMFGLTGAEARLTKRLVAGDSLAEAAQKLRIQAPTARTYLKQAFAKTGTNRQAALVQLLLTSMVRTAPGIELTALR